MGFLYDWPVGVACLHDPDVGQDTFRLFCVVLTHAVHWKVYDYALHKYFDIDIDVLMKY